MDKLSDYICFIENVLTKNQCEQVIQWYQDNIDEEYDSRVQDGVKADVRKSKSIEVPLESEIYSILSLSVNSTIYHYFNYLDNTLILKDDRKFSDFLPSEFESDPYIINKYDIDGKYDWHVDKSDDPNSSTLYSRKFSIVLYLNDNFEGGNTEFQFGYITPKQGGCLIFPSNFMYNHCSRPIKNGVKFSCASWLSPKITKNNCKNI